jgi:hypothetical protein
MTVYKKGRYWYGTEDLDIQAEVVRFSRLNEHEAVRFSAASCTCGGTTFKLESDEDAGAAKRTCARCGAERLMGDSAEYVVDAQFDNHLCVCDAEIFAITSGVALYTESNDVRWYYIGCRCINCSLVGVFANWKCQSGDADALLAET